MYSRLLAILLAAVLICSAAGCGGDTQSQGSEEDQANGQGAEEGRNTIKGHVARVALDREIFVVRSPKEEEPVVFRYKPERFEVTLDGEEAQPEDIKSGQKASVTYTSRTTPEGKQANVARSVELEAASGGGTGEGTNEVTN